MLVDCWLLTFEFELEYVKFAVVVANKLLNVLATNGVAIEVVPVNEEFANEVKTFAVLFAVLFEVVFVNEFEKLNESLFKVLLWVA